MDRKEQIEDFKKEVETLKNTADAEEYARQLAHLFLGNGLSLQTILLMAIDFGQQHPHWISVEEKLPEECELVYAIREGNVEPGIYKFMAKDQWEWAPRFIACLDDITHWMPLPDPPTVSD